MYKEKRVIRHPDKVVRYYCENGYGLSVACHEHSYGGNEGLYEIALLKGDKIAARAFSEEERRTRSIPRGLANILFFIGGIFGGEKGKNSKIF